MSQNPSWQVQEISRNVHRVNTNLTVIGDEFWVLLQSDVHWDNPKCDRELLRRHLEEAKERNAPVIDAGDFFCAMQGKYDKRSNKSDLRPEHQRADYLDALVKTGAEFLAPYRDILLIRGQGNHETSIKKIHETDLTERLTERLQSTGSKVRLGGYSGFVVFNVGTSKTSRRSIKLHYHHGHGGGGAVTRGVIQTNRMAVYLADADIILTGHTHDAWQVPIQKVRLNNDLEIEHSTQLHVRTPGYKEEYGDGYGGWHVERGGAPKPTGAAWLRIRKVTKDKLDFVVIEAR